MVVLPEADVCSRCIPSSLLFFSVSIVFVFIFAFYEALVLATSLSFGNLVSRSFSTYLDKDTTF